MNYGQLKTMVQQYLENMEATFVANLPQFVVQAEEEIFRKVQLPDLMQTSTAPIPANNPYVELPSDFLSPYSLYIVANGRRQALITKDHSFMNEFWPDQTKTGVPRYYAIFDDETMMLVPAPDQSYVLELNYFYEPISLSAGPDTGTTWLSENGENALLFATVIQGYVYMKGDQDVIKSYTEKFSFALNDLKQIAEGRNRKDVYRRADARLTT